MNESDPSHDEIARQAEDLWRERGYPQGRDDEIWFEAERKLKQSQSADAGNPRIPDITESGRQPDPSRSAPSSRERARAQPIGDGKIARDKTRD
jgi:hypothetical protein